MLRPDLRYGSHLAKFGAKKKKKIVLHCRILISPYFNEDEKKKACSFPSDTRLLKSYLHCKKGGACMCIVDILMKWPNFWIFRIFLFSPSGGRGGMLYKHVSCIFFSFLKALLRSEGHTVEFMKTPDRDDVELVVHGEIIYRCKVQDLQYGKLKHLKK